MVNQRLIKKRRKKRRIIITTSISAILVTAFIIIAFLSNYVGNFTISLIDYETRLALSTSPDMDGSTTHLKVDGFSNAVPYSVDDIDRAEEQNILDTNTGGSNNETLTIANEVEVSLYFSYTFFVTNVGDGPCYYYYGLDITDEDSGSNDVFISDALRFRIFQNKYDPDETEETLSHESIDYTKKNDDSSSDEDLNPDTAEYLAKCEADNENGDLEYFNDDSTIILLDDASTKLWPDEVIRYTILMWIEGDDPDCVGDYFDQNAGIRISAYVGSEDISE